MEEKLTSLYNTLLQIETKGESTLKMGICLNYIVGLISDFRAAESKQPERIKAEKPTK